MTKPPTPGQGDLFSDPPKRRPPKRTTNPLAVSSVAHAKNSDTSRESARRLVPEVPRVDRAVYAAIAEAGPGGLTCEQVELRINMKHQTASGAMRRLVERGLVKDSNARRQNTSGRNAAVMVIARRID